jgi:hypothetical protein
MGLNILIILFAWFAGSLAFGVLAGKSMVLGNRVGSCPDDLGPEFGGNSPRPSREPARPHHSRAA